MSLVIKTIAPTAAVLGVAAVYWFGAFSAGQFTALRLAYILVGASIYGQVAAYAYVPTAAIAEGKWSNLYPQIYITPTSSIPYLTGRCLASFTDSLPVILVSLAVSYYASRVLFGITPTFTVSIQSVLMVGGDLLASIPASLALGYILGSYSIFVSRFEWALTSYVSGLLMIFSEALFPASVLPYPLSLIAETLPFTYLMRASRDALIYNAWPAYAASLTYLLLGGLVFLSAGVAVFSLAERSARNRRFHRQESHVTIRDRSA